MHYKFRNIGLETNMPLQPEMMFYYQVLQYEGWIFPVLQMQEVLL